MRPGGRKGGGGAWGGDQGRVGSLQGARTTKTELGKAAEADGIIDAVSRPHGTKGGQSDHR